MSSKVLAFTDGACLGNPGPGGYAALLRIGEKEREIVGGEPLTTNNRMELLAAIVALEALKRPVSVVLHSDSQYVVKGMREWLAGWKKRGWKTSGKQDVSNRDLWERLDRAAASHEVEWTWVKGHAGHPENERVDRLANAEAVRERDQAAAGGDASARARLDAKIGLECLLAAEKDALARAPEWCERGPGNTGVHCLLGSGEAACPHVFVVLERARLELADRAGKSVALETDATGKGADASRIRAALRALATDPGTGEGPGGDVDAEG